MVVLLSGLVPLSIVHSILRAAKSRHRELTDVYTIQQHKDPRGGDQEDPDHLRLLCTHPTSRI